MRISLNVQRNLTNSADLENAEEEDKESRAVVDKADVKL